MCYNAEQVLTAWRAFITQDIILTDKVRPEIAASWQRCKSAGLDPWSGGFPKPSESLLHKKRIENAAFLRIATPILEYLRVLFDCNVSLSDKNGFIYELITPLNHYPRTLGTTLKEETVGSGNATIALQTGEPIRVDGYEHYRTVSQSYSGVSAPVTFHDKIIGIVNINNPFELLPDWALYSCIEASRIISQITASGDNMLRLFSTANIFQDLIEKNQNAVIVLDQDGMILTANSVGQKIVSKYQELPYATQSLADYLADKSVLPSLLDYCTNCHDNKTIIFAPVKKRILNSAVLLGKRRIILPNGFNHIVLVFKTKNHSDNISSPQKRPDNPPADYIGQSPAWQKVDTTVKKIARHKTNILLLGDTGTGKEVVARAIHRSSGRKGNFVAVNCGSIPRDLLASELFGYEGGSFTGARASGSIGKFEFANGGTLFLDEIGEMPVDMQVSLLRALQEQTITRIGSNKPQAIDCYIISATNKDMQKLIDEGKFRSDLYYRLSVFEIYLPLLKERSEDIPLLADFFNQELSRQLSIVYTPLSPEVENALKQFDWPGNVRELKNIVEKVLILSDNKPVTVDILPAYIRDHLRPQHIKKESARKNSSGRKLKDMENDEKEQICSLLEKNKGNISKAAKELGVSRNTLYKKIEKLDIRIKFSGTK